MTAILQPAVGELRSGWRPLWASIVGLHLAGYVVIAFSFGVFFTPLSREFGWSRSELSWAYSIFLAVAAISQPVVGHLVDRVGLKRTVIPLTFVYGLALISMYWLTSSKWHMYTVYAIIGLTAGASGPLPYFKVISRWFDHKRGLAFGLLMAGTSSGAMIVPALTGVLVASIGWRSAYVVWGFAVMAVIILCASLIPEYPNPRGAAGGAQSSHSNQGNDSQGVEAGDALRSRVFWTMAIAMGLMYATTLGVLGHITPMLIDYGANRELAAIAGSVFALGAFVGRLVGGYLMDRVFAPRLAATLFFGATIGLGLLLTGATGVVVYIAAFLVGLTFGAETDIMGFLTSRYFGLKNYGQIFSYIYSFCLFMGMLGPLLLGYVYDAAGSYRIAIATFAGIALVSAIMLLSLEQYRFKASNDPRSGKLAAAT
jgi:MFS family permease